MRYVSAMYILQKNDEMILKTKTFKQSFRYYDTVGYQIRERQLLEKG